MLKIERNAGKEVIPKLSDLKVLLMQKCDYVNKNISQANKIFKKKLQSALIDAIDVLLKHQQVILISRIIAGGKTTLIYLIFR